ncbi:cytochrome c [Rhizobium azibense]|nr:cytochrome c [Rhizobium azibense]
MSLDPESKRKVQSRHEGNENCSSLHARRPGTLSFRRCRGWRREPGEKLFARCSACHSVDGQEKIGPSLAGVVGRKAGSVEGARYSKALVQSQIVWTEQNLDAYLSAPATLVRGTTITVRIEIGLIPKARRSDHARLNASSDTYAFSVA